MGKKSVIVEGDTYEQALSKGLKILGLEESDVKVDVIDQGETVLGVVLKPVKLHISKGSTDNTAEKPIDAQLTTKVSNDGLEAYVILTPPDGGKSLEYQEILQLINDEGIVYGIDEQVIKELARSPVYNKDILIAQGKKPINGKDGTITYHFKLQKGRKPMIDEQGRVNYRKLDLVENIKKGQVLATITLPTEGTSGINVKGEEIPCKKGLRINLPKGKNVEVSKDGLSLLASVNGQVDIINRLICVNPVYEVRGNVDNSTGDIDFIGNVVVRGSVLTGFSIRCDGSIEVYGVVEGAKLYARGDIILRQGVQGMGKGSIISEGCITAKYIEHSFVQCKDDLNAEAIMHSRIRAGGSIIVSGRKGLIVGGNLRAGKGVIAKTIGSPMWTSTEIDVGVEPEVRERHSQIINEIQRVSEELRKAKQAISLLNKLRIKNELDVKKRILLTKSIRTKDELSKKLASLKAESFIIEEQLDNTLNSKVSVSNTLYGGVKITIGPSTLHIKEKLRFVTLKRAHGEIKTFSYEQ